MRTPMNIGPEFETDPLPGVAKAGSFSSHLSTYKFGRSAPEVAITLMNSAKQFIQAKSTD
jgi:hypothetical protein